MNRFARAFGLLTLGVICFGLAACGGAGRAPVSGKITVMGKPHAGGNLVVSFIGKDGLPVTTEVGPDGSYQASGVLVGEVRVSISSPQDAAGQDDPLRVYREKGTLTPEDEKMVEKLKAEMSKPKAAAKAGIPERYRDPATSNLKTVIERGQNTYNADLKLP
jgi:hypothetical protein